MNSFLSVTLRVSIGTIFKRAAVPDIVQTTPLLHDVFTLRRWLAAEVDAQAAHL
jgi:hypothetical protein